MADFLSIANSWQMWVACAILVVVVLIQVTVFIRLCRKEAAHIGFPVKKLNTAIKSGAVTAIGPALAGIVIMLSMMSLVGSPITWQRLSVIGSAQSEMMVADIASQIMGVTLGGAGFTIGAMTLAYFLMAFTGCGWLTTTVIFTGSMEKVRTKLSGGDSVWLGLLSAGATIGLISYMASARVIQGAGPASAVATGFLVQLICDKLIAPKWNWVRGYSMAFALIAAMVVGYLIQPV